VAYSAEEFLDCLEKLLPGQAVVYDESVRGLLSTDTFANAQKALTTALTLVRAKNLIMFLCVPDPWLIAKSFRARRATYWIACQERGVGLVHVRDDRIKYQQDDKIGLYKDPVRNPMTWNSLEGTTLWTRYYIVKKKRIDEYLKEAREELSKSKRKFRMRRRQHRKEPGDEDGNDTPSKSRGLDQLGDPDES